MSSTFQINRASVLDQNFINALQSESFPVAHHCIDPQTVELTRDHYLQLFEAQMMSRHLDLQARILKQKNQGFYTIGSSGHEGNAAFALAFKDSDIAFLHYRSTAFMIQRAHQVGLTDPILDHLRALVASKNEPISGGRHKVLGHPKLFVPPQTSTIASHLPKAFGTALGLTLSKTLKDVEPYLRLKKEGVVLCGFGDGSFNHASLQGTLNAIQWTIEHQMPLPMILICEDNGLAISVPTPKDWIEKQMRARADIAYIPCEGLDLANIYQAAKQADHIARIKRRPAFIHMKTVRLLGHAGSDIESQYRTPQMIEDAESQDPLLHSAHVILEHAWLSSDQILERYEFIRKQVQKKTTIALKESKLSNAEEVMAPIVPFKRRVLSLKPLSHTLRRRCWGADIEKLDQPMNLCQSLNAALTDLMLMHPQACLFGEDVAKKGGVYRVTQNLQQRFGQARVFDTLLDEQTILGTAIGLAHQGFLPVPEIQFLAYTHNAEDQIRGEAATLSYFSKGQFTNPMVIRVPGLGYQKGFGGHYHNDNAIGFLREIPGIVIACPSSPAQGAKLLRACFELAYRHQRVVIFLEPIALYMKKDMYANGDKKMLESYPDLKQIAHLGQVVQAGEGDFVIISYGNGAYLSRQAIYELDKAGISSVKLVDLQWLHPLPFDALKEAVQSAKYILIVDECRQTGSLSETLMAWFMETHDVLPHIQRLCAKDSYIPIGPAWETILPSKEGIVEKIKSMLHSKKH